MKKIIGILGVVVIAATMFFSANAISGSNSDTSLENIIALNTANAESNTTNCDNDYNDVCYNQNTGQRYSNCDPSNFWDTCGDK